MVNMYGFWWIRFWTSAWNIFDTLVVTIGMMALRRHAMPPKRLFRASKGLEIVNSTLKTIENDTKTCEKHAKNIEKHGKQRENRAYRSSGRLPGASARAVEPSSDDAGL